MGEETILCGGEFQSGMVPGKKRALELTSSRKYVSELQGMGGTTAIMHG